MSAACSTDVISSRRSPTFERDSRLKSLFCLTFTVSSKWCFMSVARIASITLRRTSVYPSSSSDAKMLMAASFCSIVNVVLAWWCSSTPVMKIAELSERMSLPCCPTLSYKGAEGPAQVCAPTLSSTL